MKRRLIFVLIFILLNLLIGCISNEKSIQIKIKSSHTWTLDVKIDVRVWDDYSKIDLEPDYLYSDVDKLFIDESDVFNVNFNLEEVGFIEIIVYASTIDGFSDEFRFTSINLSESYYFEVIGSGNEVKIIKTS
jgi:hypothetical protein